MATEKLQKVGFGFISDTDESLVSQSATFNFGLNTGTLLIKFEEPDDKVDDERVNFTFNKNGKQVFMTVYSAKRVLDENRQPILDTESEEYIKRYNADLKQNLATITHILKGLGISGEAIQKAIETKKPQSFREWCEATLTLLPKGYEKIPVDIFFAYQWNVKEGQTKTFPEFPKNMKGGHFVCPHVTPKGEWNLQTEWTETVKDDITGEEKEEVVKGYRNVDAEGNVHPIIKSETFLSSNRGTQQVKAAENGQTVNTAVMGGFTSGGPVPQQPGDKSSWF